jgi:hypothetical protein
MPRRKDDSPRLTVRVSFETTRLSARCLIEAYERLAPERRRTLRTAPDPAIPAEEARAEPGQESEHA